MKSNEQQNDIPIIAPYEETTVPVPKMKEEEKKEETREEEKEDKDLDNIIDAFSSVKLDENEINYEDYHISGGNDIKEAYESSLLKKWIKLIPFGKTISIDDYERMNYFIPVADIVLDNDIVSIGKKQGTKKRNTMIQFVPTISNNDFNKKNEWLYLLVINDRIVKIGGTRTGLKGRVSSYLCGHHVEERGKSGDCSKTNGFIYNTFEFYLKLGCKIQMFGYELPKTEITIEIFGKETKITAQTYHVYESTFLEDYKKKYNEYPILSDNCDPDYKE